MASTPRGCYRVGMLLVFSHLDLTVCCGITIRLIVDKLSLCLWTFTVIKMVVVSVAVMGVGLLGCCGCGCDVSVHPVVVLGIHLLPCALPSTVSGVPQCFRIRLQTSHAWISCLQTQQFQMQTTGFSGR